MSEAAVERKETGIHSSTQHFREPCTSNMGFHGVPRCALLQSTLRLALPNRRANPNLRCPTQTRLQKLLPMPNLYKRFWKVGRRIFRQRIRQKAKCWKKSRPDSFCLLLGASSSSSSSGSINATVFDHLKDSSACFTASFRHLQLNNLVQALNNLQVKQNLGIVLKICLIVDVTII